MPARIKIDDPENVRILQLLADGFEIREAADKMSFLVNTMRHRVYVLKQEMGVSNNAALVYQAVKRGII